MEVKGVVDGKEVSYVVKKPSAKDHSEAKLFSNKVAARMLAEKDENGNPTVVLRSQLESLREKLGIWDELKQKKLEELDNKIVEGLRKLTNGGKMTRKTGTDVAFAVQKLRQEKFELLLASRELDEITLESSVDNANFDYLCSTCIRDTEGNRIFNSVDDYRSRNDNELIIKCAAKLASVLYDYNENMQRDLPENKFLVKYGIVDENLRFIDKEGNFTTSDGRRVDSDNRYIDENGDYIDRDGNRVDKEGNLIGNETEIVD